MEALIFIALIIFIILLFNVKSAQKETARLTRDSFLSLKEELTELKNAITQLARKDEPSTPLEEPDLQSPPFSSPLTPDKPIVPTQVELTPAITRQETIAHQPVANDEINTTLASNPLPQKARPMSAESWAQKWLRNNPDLEKFIGENLTNKIGIGVLVLGIAFFVKYAIDQNWIKEAGRVSIGIGCGIVLTGLAHYLRNAYRSFSSVLAGGGIAVFYFTIAFAFHEYRLFSQTAAFFIMIVITAFAVLLSLLYNKPELAVIAAIGGFITPFLVSTGAGNYIILFTYLLILNLGMLTLAWFKKWHAVNVIAFLFTLIIYGGWLLQNTVFSNVFPHYQNAFIFATAFYFLFLAMGIIYNIRKQHSFNTADFLLLLVITFSYYAAGITCLNYWNDGALQGLFTLCAGALNFCLAWYFYRTKKGDKNLLYLLIGLTLTFISLAAPVQLHGHTITLFWSAELVLLYWLHQRSEIRIFKYSSGIIIVLMLISILMDWYKANGGSGDHLPVIYTNLQGFITNIVAMAAFITCAVLVKKEQPEAIYLAGINNRAAGTAMLMIAAILFYLTCLFGANLYFYTYQHLHVPNAWHQIITFLFTAFFLFLIEKYRLSINLKQKVILIAGCVILYLLSVPNTVNLRNGVLLDTYSAVHLWVHWLADLILLYLLYRLSVLFANDKMAVARLGKLFSWITNIVLITFFSIECRHAYIFLTATLQDSNASAQQYSKAGLTIVWAICSFVIMWQGMKRKYKTLRIISLLLFSLALVKLFLFDIRSISEGGKIAAFIMLGILLLIISFMYQKLKKIIIDDGAK